MRLHLPTALKKALIATTMMLTHTLQAGHMDANIGYQLYRNLGENRGPFEAGATDVTVYDINGNEIGVIPVVPDFSAVSNPGTAASLAGGQNWLADCEHNNVINNIQWGIRLGTANTPVFEEYRNINRVEANSSGSFFDLSISRLNKVVTEVVHWDIARDTRYTSDEEFLADKYIWRVGAGGQKIYSYPDGEGTLLNGAYETITAGTGYMLDVALWTRTVSNERGETIEVPVYNQTLGAFLPKGEDGLPLTPEEYNDEENLMPILGWGGDSGSPLIVYNEDTKSFQLIGIFYGYNFRGGTVWDEYHTFNFHSDKFYDFVIDSSAYHFDQTETEWRFGASDSDGFVDVTAGTLSDYDKPIRTLKQGERGDTSTQGTLASNEEMWATLDWVFTSSAETTLTFDGSFNSGAGTFQFRRGEGATLESPTLYHLTASSADVNVNNGGYIVEEHVYVTTNLTGAQGDEWRIVGENARMNDAMEYEIYGGFFEINGTGDNLANLNLGVGITVFLNREGSAQAANDVQLNTGSTVILGSSTQIGGSVEFGHMGGILDLNGHDFTRNSSNLFVLDKDAGFANYAASGEATLSYTIEGAVHEDIHASFSDSSSVSSTGSGVLNVDITADTAGASLTLDNHINIAGSLVLDGVNTTLSGYRVEIANPDATVNKADYAPAYDPDQWVRVRMDVGQLVAQNHIHLELGPHVDVSADSLTIEAGSTLRTTSTSTFTGHMDIHGAATFDHGSLITGSVTAHTGGSLDASQGGVFDVDFSIMAGASALFGARTELQGLLTNAGTVSFDGYLSITETMINTGNLNFASNLLFDVTHLTGVTVGGVTTYQIFEGSSSSSFGSLTSNNVVGTGAEDLQWTFYDDGRLVSSVLSSELEFIGGTLELREDVGGFVSGTYQDGEAIHFSTQDSTMTLAQADLSSSRIFVDGVALELISNGFSLNVDRLLLNEGASLAIRGEALQANARVTRSEDTRNVTVHIDAQGETLSGKNWLQEYAGHVELSNGSYDAGYAAVDYLSLALTGESTAFYINGVSDLNFALRGDGVLHALDASSVAFHDIDEFSGRIVTSADHIDFNTTTAASIDLADNNQLHLNAAGLYSGTLSGAGDIYAHEAGTIISALNGFTGTLYHTEGALSLAGQSLEMGYLSLGESGDIRILENTHLRTSIDQNRSTMGAMTLNVAEGSHLEELKTNQHISGGTLTISGGGTVTWEGLTLASNADGVALVIEADTTLNLLETSPLRLSDGRSAFQLSIGNYHNEVIIRGSIISNASLSSGNGYGSIHIESGGLLELKKGLIFDTAHQGASYIYVRDGGKLVIGNQTGYPRDYGDSSWNYRVEAHLSSGATVGASGTGIVTTPHTFRWAESGYVNIESLAGQDFRFNQDVQGEQVNILGGGIVRLDGVDVDTLHVANGTELYLNDASPSLVTLTTDGRTHLTQAQTANYAITGASTGELHLTDRLEARDMTGYAGTVQMEAGSELILHSSMQEGARVVMGADSHLELAAGVTFNNAHQATRTGNHHITVGAGSTLNESQIDYQLTDGKQLTVEGAGHYHAKSMTITGDSLSLGSGSSMSLDSLSMTAASGSISLGDGANLSVTSAAIAAQSTLQLSGTGSFGGDDVRIDGHLQTTDGVSLTGLITLTGDQARASLSADSKITGSIILEGTDSHLDLSQGGVHSGSIILNDGLLTLGSRLSLSQAIQGSLAADLQIESGVLFDISNLTAAIEGDTFVYTIFTGMENESFGNLRANSVTGTGSLDYDWVFSSDGTIRGTLITNELHYNKSSLNLALGVDGFDDSKTFSQNAKIRFYQQDVSLRVIESGLSVERILVEGVQLDIQHTGNKLDAGNIVLSEGASLVIHGDSLSESSRIMEGASVLDAAVSLHMDGGELAAKDWFTYFAGTVSLYDGTYYFGESAMNHRLTIVNADAVLRLGELQHITNVLRGTGHIHSEASDTISFDDLSTFSGHLDTNASIVNLHSRTSASFEVDAASTVNLSNQGGLYDGAISGQGLLHSNSAETSTIVSQLSSEFTGSIKVSTGTLEIGGEVNQLESIDLRSGSTLHLLAGTNITAGSTGERSTRDYGIHLEAGSSLQELDLIIRPEGGTFSLSGEGTYSINGLTLGGHSEGNTVNIGAHTTLHITGNDINPSDGTASFLASYNNYRNAINIDGTLISDAGVSTLNGKATISVRDGGTLILRKGGTYRGSNTNADTDVNVYTGGTLLLGKQDDTKNYGSGYNTLNLHFYNDSTLGADGTGRTDIYHTIWARQNPTLNILSLSDQEIHMHARHDIQKLNILGGGIVSIYDTGVIDSYTIQTAELNFQQESVSADSILIKGHATLSKGSDALPSSRSAVIGTGMITSTELSMDAGDHSLTIDNSVAVLQLGSIQLNNQGDMSITAVDNSQDLSIQQSSMVNAHVQRAAIVGARDVVLEDSNLSHSQLEDSSFSVATETTIAQSTLGEGVSFTLSEGSSLHLDQTIITSVDEQLFELASGVSSGLKDMVLISDATYQIASEHITTSQATLDEVDMKLYSVDGVSLLLSEATIEGELMIELMGVTLADISGVNFGIEILGLASSTTQNLSQLVWIIQGERQELSYRYSHEGNVVLSNVVIPEPSTATLSLLALTALAARRRRQRHHHTTSSSTRDA